MIPGEPRLSVEGEGPEFEYILNLPPWTPIGMEDGDEENGEEEPPPDENGDEEPAPTSVPRPAQTPPWQPALAAETGAPSPRRHSPPPRKKRR